MNGHSGIDTTEATEHLKNILNVGKSESESGKLKSVANGKMEAGGDAMVLNDGPYQKVELPANKDCSHISIYGSEVDIYSSPIIEYGASCSQVIVEDMVDYGWKEKYYHGRIISIHLSGKYLAYVLKPSSNKPSFVRILKINFDSRHLIRDYKSEVKDIAFSDTISQVLLGSVDECGEFFVHKVVDDGQTFLCTLLVHIVRPAEWIPSEHNRLIWCLYIPDDNDAGEDDATSEDVTSLLVVTHDERAEIWNIQTIIKEHGHGKLNIDEVKVGVQVISEHEQPISAATFSPDGTALAIGSLDGIVKFFQVNTLEKDISPRCLHQWTPHPEKSLSSLYFLDNYKNHRSDVQFWKFAVTGAENNTELKIWSCETWACLQTLRIHPNPNDGILPCLKAELDLSSRYLFLTDIKRKALLILLIEQDNLGNNAVIRSFSEFKVPLPVLSLAIGSISYSKLHSGIGESNSDDEGDRVMNIIEAFNKQEEMHGQYIIKLYWIQPKTLQSCRIMYKPKVESPELSVGSVSSLSQDSFVFKDGLSDISLDASNASNRSVKDLDISLQKEICVSDEISESSQSSSTTLNVLPSHITNFSNCTEVLLTPDDFTSPSHSNLGVQNFQDKSNSVSKCDSAVHLTDSIDSLPVEPITLQRRKSSQHSATSSPSREVAEILAPTKVLHLDEMVDESESLNIKGDPENLTTNLSSFSIPNAPISSRSQSDIKPDYHVKDWPQAPHTNKEYLLPSRNESDSASHNQIFHTSKNESPSNAFELNTNRPLIQLSQNFNDMILKMESLTSILQDQRCEIQSLQSEIKLLRHDQKHNQSSTNLSTKLDHLISQRVVPDNTRLESLILRTAEESHQRSEKELSLISDELSRSFGNRLESLLKHELSNCILPHFSEAVDTVGQKMQNDLSQKTALMDAGLKESVSKILKGKAFLDSLSQSISATIQSQIQSSCKDIFQASVVPAFEKSCQLLFQQLNEIFNKGTSEYIQILEKQSQSSCSAIDAAVTHLQKEMNNLVSNVQLVSSHAAQVENCYTELSKREDKLLSSIHQAIQDEVKKAFKEQATSVLNSRSVTPVPQSDLFVQKQRLLQLVKQGNIDEAFQQALSAMDVQLVIFLCEHVNPDQVFGTTPCILQQHVLLSLVNQLSADLSVKTEIKVRYIEDVIASLDCNSSIIKDHIRNVLDNLQQRITNFLQRNPNHKLSRNLKRISLAIQSLINF